MNRPKLMKVSIDCYNTNVAMTFDLGIQDGNSGFPRHIPMYSCSVNAGTVRISQATTFL